MSNQISTFNFENQSIRTITINNEPWFLSIDICNALNIANSRDAINKLDEDEYQILRLKDTVGLTDSIANQVQSVGVVSESGMYTLILRCREAVKKGSIPHRFRKWVTAEVLPQIRKTGSYSKTTVDQRTGLRNAVSMLVGKKALMYNEAYSLVHQRFNVGSIEDLTEEQLPQAVEYVHKIYLEGELIIDEPKANNDIQISADVFEAIMKHTRLAKRLAEQVEPFHRQLHQMLGLERWQKNDIASLAYGVRVEFNHWLNKGEKVLESHYRLALPN